ncbi:WW-domain ligand protein-domain-containing protein, partial [Tricladium varicosporioides]
RTSLHLSTPNTYPGALPYSAKSDGGIAYITNQRIVYLPSNPTPELQSFSVPILNLQDTFVRAPFFGANYWTATVKPVTGGGIPPTNSAIELRLTFREGGAFDFHTLFEQIKERVHQAYTVARENGQGERTVVDMGNVHLEQLPAYEAPQENEEKEESEDEEPRILSPIPVRPTRDTEPPTARPIEDQSTAPVPAPDEPPPGYEEAQVQAVSMSLEQRLQEEAER